MQSDTLRIGGVDYALRPLSVDDVLTFMERHQAAQTAQHQVSAAVDVIAAAIGRTAEETRKLLPMRELAPALKAVMATAEIGGPEPGEPAPAAVQ